jgi:hypothetical protein
MSRHIGECLEVASVCQERKSLYAAPVRFYREAFTAEPELADDLGIGHRNNAACAAALAGCSLGEDADHLSAEEYARLRKQALDWLRADLTAWQNALVKEKDKAAPEVLQRMQHWLDDVDFNGVRGAESLAKLPEAERREWQRLWDAVAALRQRSQRDHRPAIGQAVPLVRPGLVKGQCGIEVGARLRQNVYLGIATDIVNGGSSVSATGRPGAAQSVEEFGQHLIGRDDARRGIRHGPLPDPDVPGITRPGQGKPIKRVRKYGRRHARSLRPLRCPVEIVVVLGS